METTEASGKTVEDALNSALAELGASREEVELVILDEGKKGLFGRGSRDAHIRVTRLAPGETPSSPAPARPEARTPRPSTSDGGGGRGAPRGQRSGGRGGRTSGGRASGGRTGLD